MRWESSGKDSQLSMTSTIHSVPFDDNKLGLSGHWPLSAWATRKYFFCDWPVLTSSMSSIPLAKYTLANEMVMLPTCEKWDKESFEWVFIQRKSTNTAHLKSFLSHKPEFHPYQRTGVRANLFYRDLIVSMGVWPAKKMPIYCPS